MRDRTHQRRRRAFWHAGAPRRAAAARRPGLSAWLCVLVTLAVFGQVWRFAFVWWDDGLHVYDNPLLQSLTFDHVLAFWRAPYAELYIPLTYTLWALTAAVARGTSAPPAGADALVPAWFHGLNLLGHLVCVLVVWRLVCLLLDRTVPRPAPALPLRRVDWAACGGTLLFAVHPLQVEAVAWVTGFKDVLCGVLSCVALWQYVQYARGSAEAAASDTSASAHGRGPGGRYWLATGIFASRCSPSPRRWSCRWSRGSWMSGAGRRPGAAGSGRCWRGWDSPCCGAGSRVRCSPRRRAPSSPLSGHDSSLRVMRSTFYLSQLALPLWLGPDYGRSPAVVLSQGWYWLTGLLPWGLAVWLWFQRRRRPWLVATASVLVAGLLPVLGLVPFAFQTYSTVADRYMYLAMLGPALALAWGLARVPRRWVAVGCAVTLGVLGLRCAWQAHYWRDSVTLFEHALTVNPRSSVAYNTLGMVLAAHNRLPEATRYYTEAMRLPPPNPQAHNNLGNVLRRQGQMAAAMQQYQAALRLKPTFAEAQNNLGATLADQGRMAEAIRHYTVALQLHPRYVEAHFNLGNALRRQGQMAEAMQQYQAALRLKPTFAEAHNNLGATLADQGRVAEAIRHYTVALQLHPRYVEAHFNLGVALARQGQFTEARQHVSEVLRLDPSHAAARQLLERGMPPEATPLGASGVERVR